MTVSSSPRVAASAAAAAYGAVRGWVVTAMTSFYALLHGLPLEQGARMGSLMGSLKISNSGPQSITIPCAEIHERFEREFGAALA